MDPVGRLVRKHFPSHGWFAGEVRGVIRVANRRYYRVVYEDGDVEDVSEVELKQILVEGGGGAAWRRPEGGRGGPARDVPRDNPPQDRLFHRLQLEGAPSRLAACVSPRP
ncbi:unnamed protein product [Ostreobium quekettii]|uniref:PTM/DIR17-like Tudor domain-containing protein n=1 Tax=Ostreobium quekettii TaxID=121088 RepID=A0A8S1IU96_9CHLO|nr:unnamed protein product [Ostreobium quekettii]